MTNGILALDCYIDSGPLSGATRDCGGIIVRLIFDGTLIRGDRESIDPELEDILRAGIGEIGAAK